MAVLHDSGAPGARDSCQRPPGAIARPHTLDSLALSLYPACPTYEIPLAHVCNLPAGAAHLAKESCHPRDPLLDQPADVRNLRQACRRQARPTAVLILWEAQILHQRDWGGKMRSCRQGKEMARSGGGQSPHLLYASCSCITMVEYSIKSRAPMLLPTIFSNGDGT